VLAKVVVDDPFSAFVTNVTICNNRQNPVLPWTLRANDRIQCDLAGKFREDVHILYSRQENAIQSRSQEELEELGIEDTRDIRIRPLAQTFLAVQGEIVRMRQLPSVFENQKWYDETFRETYLQCDARKIILSYKVHLMIRSAMKRLEERAGENIRYAISKARDLVWALLIQGILNDPTLPKLLDTYGTGLKKEAEYREYLMNMASSRLLPILRKLLAEDDNRKKLAAEKYEFMRSVPVFRKCMDIAHSQYGWVKKSF
jgi:AIPR protein